MSIDVTTYALAKKYTDKKIVEAEFGEGAVLPDIENGDGDRSLQQKLDTQSWTSSNEWVKEYVKNSTPGANNGATINGTTNGNNVTINVGAFGKLSTMMNGKSQAMGGKAHAEGSKTIALENNSHTEGNETFAAGAHSHAEGNTTSAIGSASHAEGQSTVASGDYSHAEGVFSVASGHGTHAEGHSTANNTYTHAEGYGTIASGNYSHVSGTWNIEDLNNKDDDRGNYAVIVGNGIENKRSNAHTLDWYGNAWFAGDITINHEGKEYKISQIIEALKSLGKLQ